MVDDDDDDDDEDYEDEEDQGENDEDEEYDDDDDEDDEDDEEDEIEIDAAEIFEQLAKGKSTVSFATVKKWDVIDELLKSEELSEEELQSILSESITTKKNQFNAEEFEEFLTRLFGDEGDDDYDEEEEDE